MGQSADTKTSWNNTEKRKHIAHHHGSLRPTTRPRRHQQTEQIETKYENQQRGGLKWKTKSNC